MIRYDTTCWIFGCYVPNQAMCKAQIDVIRGTQYQIYHTAKERNKWGIPSLTHRQLYKIYILGKRKSS